jgi:starch-binding outer membrane protein, SusD/RagB family
VLIFNEILKTKKMGKNNIENTKKNVFWGLHLFDICYTKLALVLITTFLTTSCNDDFLERVPLDEVSEESFWNTEADISLYNLTLYNTTIHDGNNNLHDANSRFNPEVNFMFTHGNGGATGWFSPWYYDGASDNMAPIEGGQTYLVDMRSGTQTIPVTATSQRFGYKGWSYLKAVNYGLANYDKVDIAPSVRNKYVAEARLFRAWFYFDKVSKFGDVPWVDKPLNIDSEELFAPRTPREEVMDNVLEDLKFAVLHLPADWGDGNEPGRLNRWCALLVKARVSLFEGTWRKYHGGSNPEMWLQEAASAAKELIDDGPYSLYTTGNPESDYSAYHQTVDISGNPEVMYYKKYVSGVGLHGNRMQDNFHRRSSYVTRSLVEDYLSIDGLPITLSPLYEGDESIETLFNNRDPRLRQSVLHPADSENLEYFKGDNRSYPRVTGMSGDAKSTTGYHWIKFYNPDDFKAYSSETPAIILRFAEALLIYAEAQAELGIITQNDLDISINLLRDRVDMPHLELNPPMDPRYSNDGISSLLVEIRRERRIELAIEGFRYDDLRRWKQGKKLEKKDLGLRWDDAARARYVGANVRTFTDSDRGIDYIDPYAGTDWETPVFDENKHYLWPIPLDIIGQNPNIEQNPGWRN